MNALKVIYLPTIHVFLATETRTDRRVLTLADDGFYPGLRRTNISLPNGKCEEVVKLMPASRTEEIEVEVEHVWAVAATAEQALNLASLRRGV